MASSSCIQSTDMETTIKERQDRVVDAEDEKGPAGLEHVEAKATTIIEHPDDVRRHKQIKRRLDVSDYLTAAPKSSLSCSGLCDSLDGSAVLGVLVGITGGGCDPGLTSIRLNRSNLGNAKLQGLLSILGDTKKEQSDHYANALSVFYVSYIVGDIELRGRSSN